MIPKVLHQIWLGGSVPEPYHWFAEHFKELHPDWEYVLWTDENLPALKNQDQADFFFMKMFKSDIARYEILEEHGGVYADMDIMFIENIDPLLNRECLAILQPSDTINNCLIGVTPNHRVMQYCIDQIPLRVAEQYKQIGFVPRERRRASKIEHTAGCAAVGPKMLQDAIASEMPECELEPSVSFCPVRYHNGKRDQFNGFPDSYGVHFWNSAKGGTDWIEVHKTLPCYLRAQK